MRIISGNQSIAAPQNQSFITKACNTLSGIFRGMTCCFKRQDASVGKTVLTTRSATQTSVPVRQNEQAEEETASVSHSVAPLTESKTIDAREINVRVSLRGGNNPLEDLGFKLGETIPKFKVKDADLKNALGLIGEENVEDFHKYVKGFQKYLNKNYDSEFIITVAKEYVAYTAIKNADPNNEQVWNLIFEKAREYKAVAYDEQDMDSEDENMSISSTAAPQTMETPSEKAWRELQQTFNKVNMMSEKPMNAGKFKSYAFQRIAIETEYLPNHNPFVAGRLLQ